MRCATLAIRTATQLCHPRHAERNNGQDSQEEGEGVGCRVHSRDEHDAEFRDQALLTQRLP